VKTLDVIILIPILWGVYKGYQKGLLLELSMLFAFLLATIMGFKLINVMMHWLQPYFGSDNKMMPAIAFIITFLAVLIGINMLTKIVKRFLDVSILGSLDNVGGAVLGVLKATFILSTLMWLIDSANILLPQNLTEGTVVYPYLVKFSPALLGLGSKIIPFAKDLIQSMNELIVAPQT